MEETNDVHNDVIKNTEKLRKIIDEYQWYHTIKVADGVYTKSVVPNCKKIWDFNLECMKNVDFKDKKVLDIGCRDGLFSFEAEKMGAREIIGIDNNISKGAVDFLIPFFKSKVKMYELNLYDLTPEKFSYFDIIMFYGVLYHLRYPFWGLKKISDCLVDGGILMLEGGMLVSEIFESIPFLYCPVEDSPYEATSCTFFNKKALSITMHSLKYSLSDYWTLNPVKLTSHDNFLGVCKKYIKHWVKKLGFIRKDELACNVDRQFFIFRKDTQIKVIYKEIIDLNIEDYWNRVWH